MLAMAQLEGGGVHAAMDSMRVALPLALATKLIF